MKNASSHRLKTSKTNSRAHQSDQEVRLRDLPYPYRSMLAICSDLDETPDRQVYWEIMRFLNTTETTAMGPGAGLNVGNSIYFDMPQDQFAYWNTDDTGRAMVQQLIRSGHIDCLHSYGDLATSRSHAERALDELTRHDCRLEVWMDHAVAPTNFDPGIMFGHGNESGHPAYHADLTLDYGIQYVWCGRVTSVLGQDIPPQFGGILKWNHPLSSGRTLLKEFSKQQLAKLGNKKYAMHGTNSTLRPTSLGDRRRVYEFLRCNPHWGGVSSCDQGRYLARVLSRDIVTRLVQRGGTCILYTHLGKIDNPDVPFDIETVAAFRLLASEQEAGNLLLTTTRRLLGYSRALRASRFSTVYRDNGLTIDIQTQETGSELGDVTVADLQGLTFYVPDAEVIHVTVNGREIASLNHNRPDETGRPSVSLPWPFLEFPDIGPSA